MNVEKMNIDMFGEAAAYLENSRRQMDDDFGEVIKSAIEKHPIETFLTESAEEGLRSSAHKTYGKILKARMESCCRVALLFSRDDGTL